MLLSENFSQKSQAKVPFYRTVNLRKFTELKFTVNFFWPGFCKTKKSAFYLKSVSDIL